MATDPLGGDTIGNARNESSHPLLATLVKHLVARPNPKTYPFNYIVHEGDTSTEFATYVEAEEYVKQKYVDGHHEHFWSTDRGSRLTRLPWSEFADPHKYVWTSESVAERFAQLDDLVKAQKLDEAKTFIAADVGEDSTSDEFEPLDQLAALVFRHTHCAIERRRDAYEAAMDEFDAERSDDET